MPVSTEIIWVLEIVHRHVARRKGEPWHFKKFTVRAEAEQLQDKLSALEIATMLNRRTTTVTDTEVRRGP